MAGDKLRAMPALGHLGVRRITAGLVDRAIDRWEETYSRSTVKNTVAALVLDEAVRVERGKCAHAREVVTSSPSTRTAEHRVGPNLVRARPERSH